MRGSEGESGACEAISASRLERTSESSRKPRRTPSTSSPLADDWTETSSSSQVVRTDVTPSSGRSLYYDLRDALLVHLDAGPDPVDGDTPVTRAAP